MNKFLDYFNPDQHIHLVWYSYLMEHGTWPKEMYPFLSAYDVETPMPVDTVLVAMKIAQFYVNTKMSS